MSDVSPLHLLVRKLDNHVELDDEEKAALLALPHVVRSLPAGAYVVREGDKPDKCAILLNGFAFRQKLTSTGERQIVSVHIPGDALDMQHLFLDCADHSVQMLTMADVAIVPRSALRQLAMRFPVIAHAFAVNNQVEASIAREWVLNVGRRDAKTRLAHLLCEMATLLDQRGLADDYGYELPMTQEQLADATGLTPIHVNRTLMALQREGWIERDKRTIRMPDPESLKKMADFNPLYLHLGRQASARPNA